MRRLRRNGKFLFFALLFSLLLISSGPRESWESFDHNPVYPSAVSLSAAGDTIGLYNSTYAAYFLKTANEGGAPDIVFQYGANDPTWIPLMGDWDGDGDDSVGVYVPSLSIFFLKDTNAGGASDYAIQYGPPGAGWTPLVGDWDGDGDDTLGMYDPSNSAFYLSNELAGGAIPPIFYGAPGWTPLTGDWDGNGTDTVGVYNSAIAAYYLRNSNTNGGPDLVFQYGANDPTWVPMMGDWDGDGDDTVGVYIPSVSVFFLKNTNAGGASDLGFQYGPPGSGWIPLKGNFEPSIKNPGTYVYASYGEPDTLDPHWTYETTGWGLQSNIYEGLVWFERENTDSFVPVLATSWGANAAGDEWTFDIRSGVTFHEGGTLEPHDVAYSMWRALLQDRIDGPHWLTHEMFFGTYSMLQNVGDGSYGSLGEASPAELVAACNMVKAAIVPNDGAGTVTYYLNSPAPWFLAVMSRPFAGAVMDMEWMVANGDWDGDCDTWQNFHDPAADESILFDFANGTGPYKLDHWTFGNEIVLTRNDSYWRTAGDPMWTGGPSGIPNIERFEYQVVDEWATRLAMFEAGDADSVQVDNLNYPDVEPYYGIVECAIPGHQSCVEPAEGGWIHAYVGNTRPYMTPAQFNWQINSEGGNVFQGSGQLDGNGIPDDFFQDEHIRRAFSFCFDYDTMITEAFDGEGIQAQGPIIKDMLGYRNDGFVFSYDPAQCIAEFQASATGVWGIGFYMQIGYNTGNETRRLAAEILKAGIEAVNPNFQIAVVGMPWPVLLDTRRAGKLPIYPGGWIEDFHDPHNWVHPFLHSTGAYSRVVNMTEPTKSEFDALIEEAASYSDPNLRRPIYEAIQLKAQDEAVDIWMYQLLARYHFSPWIQGWYFNAAYPAPAYTYIYALDKAAP